MAMLIIMMHRRMKSGCRDAIRIGDNVLRQGQFRQPGAEYRIWREEFYIQYIGGLSYRSRKERG